MHPLLHLAIFFGKILFGRWFLFQKLLYLAAFTTALQRVRAINLPVMLQAIRNTAHGAANNLYAYVTRLMGIEEVTDFEN